MSMDFQQERLQVHALLDLVPPAKLGAVRGILEGMIDSEADVTEEDHKRLQDGQAWFEERQGKGISMEDVLADFGMKPEDFPLSK